MKQGRAAAAPPDSGFYHANNAKGTGLGETIPQPQLGPNTTFLRFRPTMRNVFGGLSFNLTRVAAEGAPGTSSHDCYDRSGGRRGENLNLVPHISVCTISYRSSVAAWCVRACVCFVHWCVCVFCSWLLLARSATPLWFPGEETRFLLHCNIWFITIRNSTSVRLLCLKKSSQRPKEQGGKKSTKEALPWNWQLLLCCAIWCICQGTEKG